jgi:hypothetical protein
MNWFVSNNLVEVKLILCYEVITINISYASTRLLDMNQFILNIFKHCLGSQECMQLFNTLRTGDANLRFYITTAQDG